MYPLPASDGASIVVCGHSNGLSILKICPAAQRSQVSQGLVNTIESSSDNIAPLLSATPWLEIELDSPVQRIAFPPVSYSSKTSDYLQSHLILVAACANSSIYVVSFALNEKRNGSNISITKVNSADLHHDLVSSLAVTWTVGTQNTTTEQSRAQSHVRSDDQSCSLLLASISTTGNGLLLVHKVSLLKHAESQKNASRLIIRRFLRLPLLASTISFSSSVYPSAKHSLLLVSSCANGVVKIFNTIEAAASRKRKRSEKALEPEDSGSLSILEDCLTLYTGFNSAESSARRKRILDAKWCSRGRSIIALLEGEEWGVWDLESLSDDHNTASGLSKNEVNISSKSSARNPGRFALQGALPSAATKRKVLHPNSVAPFIPTTPHTRKSRSANLFDPKKQPVDGKQQNPSSSLGHISVCAHQAHDLSNDDSIILTYDNTNDLIPSLFSQRRSNATKSGGAAKASKVTLQALSPIQVAGEQQLSVHIIPQASKASSGLLAAHYQNPDLLVITDSRLIIHTQSQLRNSSDSASLTLPLRRAERSDSANTRRLRNDEVLDLDAMDKMLESMDNDNMRYDSSRVATSTSMKPSDESTLTQMVESESPTAAKSIKSKLVVNKQQQPLFS